MILSIVIFAFAAAIGAFVRFQLGQWLTVPWGTLLVNVLGSLLIGFLAVYLGRHSPQTRVFVLVAFLGSLTTFSTYSLELVQMFEQGALAKALLYTLSTHLLACGSCFMGWRLAQTLVINS